MRRNLILGLGDPRFEEFIDIPLEIGKRHEPVIRGKGVSVWTLVIDAKYGHLTPEQISQLWSGYLTTQEIETALAYFEAYPELFEERVREMDEGLGN
jgi:uncharacterized protein (DUF433 family)